MVKTYTYNRLGSETGEPCDLVTETNLIWTGTLRGDIRRKVNLFTMWLMTREIFKKEYLAQPRILPTHRFHRSFDENFYRAVAGLELEHLKSTLQFPVALSSNTNTITHPNLIYSQDINAPDNTPSCANSQSLSECRFNRSYQRKPPLCRKHNSRDEKHTTCPLRAALRQKAQSTL
jgi:hypothetical protein